MSVHGLSNLWTLWRIVAYSAPHDRSSANATNLWCPAAEISKDDIDLGDEDLDAGAWGDPGLDIEAGEPGENGVAEMDHEEGEEGEEAEGGWEMEVCTRLLTPPARVACPRGHVCMPAVPGQLVKGIPTSLQFTNRLFLQCGLSMKRHQEQCILLLEVALNSHHFSVWCVAASRAVLMLCKMACRTWSCLLKWQRHQCMQRRQRCLRRPRRASQHRSGGCRRATWLPSMRPPARLTPPCAC